jgi:hypothetical protein
VDIGGNVLISSNSSRSSLWSWKICNRSNKPEGCFSFRYTFSTNDSMDLRAHWGTLQEAHFYALIWNSSTPSSSPGEMQIAKGTVMLDGDRSIVIIFRKGEHAPQDATVLIDDLQFVLSPCDKVTPTFESHTFTPTTMTSISTSATTQTTKRATLSQPRAATTETAIHTSPRTPLATTTTVRTVTRSTFIPSHTHSQRHHTPRPPPLQSPRRPTSPLTLSPSSRPPWCPRASLPSRCTWVAGGN